MAESCGSSLRPLTSFSVPATFPRRRPGFPFSLAAAVRDCWRWRELLGHLTVRNVRVQYKQSALGYAWLILNPLTQVVTLTFIFSGVFKTPSQGSPFVVFLCIGLFPWIFFANALSTATESML